MAYMRLYCDVCGGSWEIYHRDIKNDKARQCPHCCSKINKQTWERHVLPAFVLVHDANLELFKDHATSHGPLFTYDVIADHIYENKCPIMDVIDELKEQLNSN